VIAWVLFLVACIAFAPVIDWILNNAWEPQLKRNERKFQIFCEISGLRDKIENVYRKYDTRKKGETFKKAYSLQGRSQTELEEALAVGMFHEQREVFIAAFMRDGIAVRITASIGSPYKCSASDNPQKWGYYMSKLRCTELRQYHNHPVHNGSTEPSLTDIRTSGKIGQLLGAQSSKLKSLIIFWNSHQEWKVLEYAANGQYWISHEFDASIQCETYQAGQLSLDL
jgi:DNA repair protein RadC